MKRLVFTYLIILVIILTSFELEADNKEIVKLIQQISVDDTSSFKNNYLAEGFSFWKRNVKFNSPTMDIYFKNGDYEEIWLNFNSSLEKNQYTLAILIDKTKPIKIIDFRKILIADKSQFQSREIELFYFVERFLWVYEIGRDDFLEDLLFPNFIKLFYRNSDNKKEIIKELRKFYNKTLPVEKISWEENGEAFTVRLQLDSVLIPLEINIDIKRYITTHFFNIADKKDRVAQLNDSLKVWKRRVTTGTGTNLFYVNAKSSQEAINKFLTNTFIEYELDISKNSENENIIEARLHPIHDLNPLNLKFQLNTEIYNKDSFKIILTRLPMKIKKLKFEINDESGIPNKIKKSLLSKALNESILRYTYLGINNNIRYNLAKDDAFKGRMIIHSFINDSLTWDNLPSFEECLVGLTQNKSSYYFIRKVAIQEKTCDVVGYALWKDKNLFWHHVVKVIDRYNISKGDHVKLKNVFVDLYPFVRTENVTDLFGKPENNFNKRGKMQILR